MAHGHQIPTMDMAKLFAERGVRATIVTTPCNLPLFSKTHNINNVDIEIIKFPAVEAGLLEGCENVDSLNFLDMVSAFTKATQMLQQPFEQLVQDHQPSCLVADMFFPWATDIAAKFAIPRLIFHGTCFFLFVQTIVRGYMNITRKFHLILKLLSFLIFRGRSSLQGCNFQTLLAKKLKQAFPNCLKKLWNQS